jgi:hypothetical protein
MALSNSPHEAEAALAAERATKLMLQWVIDEAELAGEGSEEEPISVMVSLPGDKGGLFDVFLLLQAVAQAHGCLALFHRFGEARRGSRAIERYATLAGFAAEVEAVQQMFAMLAGVMATEMRHGWRQAHDQAEERFRRRLAWAGRDDRVRLSNHGQAAYRRGFYQGFIARVGARLEAARDQVEREQAGTNKALVLAGRQEKVKGWAEDNLHARTEEFRAARMSLAGWEAGTASGDRAPLGPNAIERGR